MTVRAMQAAALAAMLVSGVARGQQVALPDSPLEPRGQKGTDEPLVENQDYDIDLANVVTSAAKKVTTLQEAPAIVSVITADDLRSRGYRTLNQALATLPGWLESYIQQGATDAVAVRGVATPLLLHDGISAFDPTANLAWMTRTQPIENLKRIEVVTGPGGVLWGANSFLGIVNLISKDAGDVNGIEVSAGYGDGRGNSEDVKAYVLFGKSFWMDRIKIFQHVSYESFIGTTYTEAQAFSVAAPPNPGGTAQFGPTTALAPTRSWMVIADGKYSFGPVTLSYMLPFGDIYTARSVTGAIAAPGSKFNIYDRWAVLEYKDRFARDKLQVTARGYYSQFERTYKFQIYAPSVVAPPFTNPDGTPNPGGLQLHYSGLGQRVGGTVDFDGQLPYHLRLLVGTEAFYEGLSGANSQVPSPVASALPLLCPLAGDGSRVSDCPLTFINDASRIVGAAYGDLQWRLPQGLLLDGGVRLQKGFGQRPYDWTPLYSATLVWNFFRTYYFKANYATGFRPPTFQNTDAAPGSLNWIGNPSLKNETSQAFQGELNGRLLRDVAYVRELEVRVDYSYTVLDNLILREGQLYANSGNRAIHSVEAFARLYLQGDHFLQGSYTYLESYSSQTGAMRSMPHHWLSLSAVMNIVKSRFDLNATLTVLGPFEDPKRYPSGPGSIPGATSSESLTAITFDPAPAVALLQLGARVRLVHEQLIGSVQLYNVLDQHYYLPNPVYDLVPQAPANLIAAAGFSFFASLAYHPRF